MTQPHIWVPKFRIIEPRAELKLPPMRVEGRYKLIAGKRDGRQRELTGWFPNLITDSGLNAMGTLATWLQQARVGTGTDAPSTGDTALQTQVATTGTNNLQARSIGAESDPPYYGRVITTHRFGEGVAAGNLAEVGIGINSGALFSRARIVDGEGAPTTITVLSDEFLDVVYELRLYPPTEDVVDLVDLGGSDLTFEYTLRAANANDVQYWSIVATENLAGTQRWNGTIAGRCGDTGTHIAYSGTIGAITSNPSGTTSTANAIAQSDYVNGNFYRDNTITWGLNNGNVGGIQAIVVQVGHAAGTVVGTQSGRFGRYQIGFDSPIPKDNTNVLELVFRSAWARKAL